jgi:hypothetical protein
MEQRRRNKILKTVKCYARHTIGQKEIKESFLKIGLFDIWMSNEDRHYENFNLLYNLKEKRYVPIDHAMCFNSGNLDKAPSLIGNNESILTSPFVNRFFYRPLQQNFNDVPV